MDEMTVERACEILNKAEWRGRDDWHVGPDALADTSRADYLRNVSSHTSRVNYALDDAIAIAAGKWALHVGYLGKQDAAYLGKMFRHVQGWWD